MKGSSTTEFSLDTINADKDSIRKWGCHRTETPLIFVHIGKAGGGEIRERLAGSAQNFSRKFWHATKDDEHFYPIYSDPSNRQNFRRAKFCNSNNQNIMIPLNNKTIRLTNRKTSFEGDMFCNATTPFGMAIACPMGHRSRRLAFYQSQMCLGCNDEYYLETQYYRKLNPNETERDLNLLVHPPDPSRICDTVYVGHNTMGAELNWLPPRYLKEHWWEKSPWKKVGDERFDRYWESLLSDRNHRAQEVLKYLKYPSLQQRYSELVKNDTDSPKWCPNGYSAHGIKEPYFHRASHHNNDWESSSSRYENCTLPIGQAADGLFRDLWKKSKSTFSGNQSYIDDNNYSPVYASMPLQRITMIREPFSWLISKFFWDQKVYLRLSCQDIHASSHENPTISWIELYSYQYLIYLCGIDCETRYENKQISLEGIAAQAESNLRNSFSVVGLLHESDSFYEMLDQRIAFLDFNQSFRVDGHARHKSHFAKQKPMCQKLYLEDETFREKIRAEIPAFQAMERVYNVGVEVNRFQKQELQECTKQ
eukprot:CAMPEP_0116117408 /NCGR_PEP_ID=MMETSP0329-20121206/1556_1 /TAXON_ID=697910 /ORGANISM="Pseudo-nitzschia arenysensis, Strain B593" /LENGTH=535 /DNA_ID=CAMNT_0003610969 /DNA_START=362 /DNA_END=1969 /DNA_ORIENTATION=-